MSNQAAVHATLFERLARTFVGVTEGDVKTLAHTSDMILILDISAVAGTSPTLDVIVEEFDPATGTYALIDTFPQQTTAVKVRRTIAGGVTGRFLRAKATIGGSAGQSFTFAVGALAA